MNWSKILLIEQAHKNVINERRYDARLINAPAGNSQYDVFRNIMRLLPEIIIALAMVAKQVFVPVEIPFTESAKAAEAPADLPSNYTLTFKTDSSDALVLKANKGTFESDYVAPLKNAQAQKAAAEAEQARANAARATSVATSAPAKAKLVIGGDDAWAQLRFCEAGGDYSKNTGNGYYGAYQYDIRTWANYGGFARPDLAPPEVQDAKARATQAARGWSPWPACARKLGLL